MKTEYTSENFQEMLDWYLTREDIYGNTLKDKITKNAYFEIAAELENMYNNYSQEPENTYQAIFDAIKDGERNDYLKPEISLIDCWKGYIDNIFTHGYKGDIIEAVKEKQNFSYLLGEYESYSKAIYDTEGSLMLKPEPSDSDLQALQLDYIDLAKTHYEEELTEEELELFDFENRDKITIELAKKHKILYDISTPQLKEIMALESKITYAQTQDFLSRTQPAYEPGTYFSDAVEKINNLNSPKRKALKI